MSEEETKVEAATEAAATEDSTTDVETTDEAVKAEGAEAGEAAPKKKGKKWPIVVGVVAVVLIAAGAGFWVWHEQPSFCDGSVSADVRGGAGPGGRGQVGQRR